MELAVSIAAGIALAAAAGFRVFVPLLVLSVAARLEDSPIRLAEGFLWLGSWPATVVFGVATLVEVAGYFIPWVDHALDTIASPASLVAGTLLAAATMGDADPVFRWAAAVVAGGGAAAAVQGTTVLARAGSALTTGGLGNPLVALFELAGAVVTAVLAILIPLAVGLTVVGVACFLAWRLLRRRSSSPATPAPG
jgi:hypothetical protein